MPLIQLAAATKYVWVPLSATDVNKVPLDISGDSFTMSFPSAGQPPSVWWPALWHAHTVPGWNWIGCLVGPTGGTTELGVGQYGVYVTAVDDPEVDVEYSGLLTIT
jgi:hypothetical protein